MAPRSRDSRLMWPTVAHDSSIVGSVADEHLPFVSRLFLPLAGAYGTRTSWAPLFNAAGRSLDASSRWDEFLPPGGHAAAYRPQSGTVDSHPLGVIVDALRALHVAKEVDAVFWDVYA